MMKNYKARGIFIFLSLFSLMGCVSHHPNKIPDSKTTFSLTADESYTQSVELLSDGRQIEAEELIDLAVFRYPDDVRLLFAKAVMERSRWFNEAAHQAFTRIMQLSPDTEVGWATELAIALDFKKDVRANLIDLIRLSDDTPNDIYLLWLSAIQCREQRAGEFGKQQYEKLLKHFRVGPVMVHHTYANILTEYLHEYDKAMVHRHIAVALEAKAFTLQGLANTLTDMENYELANAVWARAVQLDPDDDDYWAGWGRTLYYLKRYDVAVSKCLEATRLNPNDGYNWFWAGWCYEELKRHDEAAKCFQKAVDLNYNEALEDLGWCYQFGNGVEKDGAKAFELYSLSASKTDSAKCRYRLGDCYNFGIGVKADKKKAIFYYREAIQRYPKYGDALNNLAWLLATAGDHSIRDYPEAVRLAERAVAAEEIYSHLDTLAVAYAANGQYEQAAQAQKQLIAFCQNAKTKEETITRLTARLANYEKEVAKQAADAVAH